MAKSSVHCPANMWTQVEWYVGTIALTKSYTASNKAANIQWRWFSAGVPPYWAGSFKYTANITLVASLYVSLEFKPDRDVTIFFGLPHALVAPTDTMEKTALNV